MNSNVKFIIAIVFLFFSCSSLEKTEIEIPIEEKDLDEIKFEPLDSEDVEESYKGLISNQEKRKDVILDGIERAKKFRNLFLKLYNVKHSLYELKLSDLRDIDNELLDVSTIMLNENSKEFITMSAQDKIRVDTIYHEAKKGVNNNTAFKELEKRNIELQKEIDEKYTESTIKIAEKFLWFGGIFLAISCFTSFSVIAPISKKLQTTGGILLLTGGLIMLFGTFIEFIREFLKSHGDRILIIALIPLIGLLYLMFVKKADKTIDVIKDDDNVEPP